MPSLSRKTWYLAAVLLAVTLTYANHFGNGFHFDDGHAITANPAVRSLANVPRFFSDTTTSSVLPANQTYRPIVSTSLALDYALGRGYSPPWFQGSTFLIFLIQLLTMYALFARIIAKSKTTARYGIVALAATAWYGLHPAIAETINYIVQRADVYSTFGVVLALFVYVRFPKLRRTGLYLVPALIGMFSKAPAVVFPLLLFAYIVLFESGNVRAAFREAFMKSLPALVLSFVSLVVQHAMTPPTFTPSTLSASAYIGTQPYVLLRYAASFFLPLHLNVDSDLQTIPLASPNAVVGYAFLVALIVTAALAARNVLWRPAAFGLFWFVIGDIPTAVFPLSELENDHRMFFPFVGLTLAVTWTIAIGISAFFASGARAGLRRFVPIASVVVLAFYAVGTVMRNRVWSSDEALWYDAAQKSPKNGRALMNYGLSEMQLGKYPTAKIYFDRAEPLTPNYESLEINQGVLAGATGRDADAQRYFTRAIGLAPTDEQARVFYARWLRTRGRIEDSIAQAEIGTRIASPALDSRATLMSDLDDEGRREDARALAAQTLRLVPGDATTRAFLYNAPPVDAHYWLAASSRQYSEHRYDASIASAKKALATKTLVADAYNNIGAAEMAEHHFNEAIDAERRALAIEPSLQLARNNLKWSLEHRTRTTH